MTTIYERIPASPEDVEQFAGEIPEAYLHCRVWHHDPEPHNITLARGVEKHPTAVWDATLRCSHGCGVQWRVLVDGEGFVLERRIDYANAPGYVMEGKGRIDKRGNQILRRTYFVSKVGTKKGRRR